MSEKEAFPSAYSSFAVSVDSRNAERPSYSTPSSDSGSGILRQSRPTSAYGYHEKKRSLSPRSQDRLEGRNFKPGVRFTKDVIHEYTQREAAPLHHRRSSTAAFMEYVRTHFPEGHNGTSLSLTPKRAMLLFVIVFSATWLALGLLPVLAGLSGFGSPVTVVIRRSDGYYGNSHIFRGGENLADPHLAGDEHHQYLAHAANAQQGNDGAAHEHGSKGRQKQKTLRTSTLAEEASLQDAKVARAKAKAEALARAQLLTSQEEEEDSFDSDTDLKDAELAHQAREDARRRRPLMPLKQLAEKGKADKKAAKKHTTGGSISAEEVNTPLLQQQDVLAALDTVEGEQHEEETITEEDQAELEGIIAKLRQEALDRRLAKIHRAQRDTKASYPVHDNAKKARDGGAESEAQLRRPGIVKSRKVSTKED